MPEPTARGRKPGARQLARAAGIARESSAGYSPRVSTHAAREWWILAICPPGSMERVLNDLRATLFERWGCVSALALPPLIPLAFLADRIDPLEFSLRFMPALGAARFELEGFARAGGYHYLAVGGEGSGALLDAVRAAVPRSGEHPEELFPLADGVLLAGPDLAEERIGEAVTLPAERRFGSYALKLYRVSVRARAECWWEFVSWRAEAAVPVKKSGAAMAEGSSAGSARGRPR